MTDAQILQRILDAEGGYSDHPYDAGSATNFGITRSTLAEWRGHPVTKDDVRQLTEDEARAIYTARYLAPFASVDPAHKPQVVDIAVNSGVTTARALYAVAQANHGSRSVNTQLVIERLKHYARIVKAKPTQSVFLLGWTNRAVSFLTLWLLCVAPVVAQAPDVDAYHHMPLAAVATTRWTHVCTTGVITYRRKQQDQDWHLRIEDGGAFVIAEIIPQIPLPAPPKGTRVEVCGITRIDRAHRTKAYKAGWPELHPVTAIKQVTP